MKIKTLSISNFVCFGDDIIVDFTDKNEIIVLGSINGDPQLSNGAGKSMLLESVFWALTGKFARDAKLLDVSRDTAATGSVEVTFGDGEREIVVRRERKGSKSSVAMKVDDGDWETYHNAKEGTEAVLKFLHTNPLALQLSCFFGIKYSRFTLLSANEKMDLIQNALNLAKWDNYKKKAGDKVKELTLSLEGELGKATTLQETLEKANQKISEVEKDIDTNNKELLSMKASHEQDIVNIDSKYKEEKKKLGYLNDKVKAEETKLSEYNLKMESAEKDVDALEKDMSKQHTELQYEHTQKVKEIAKLKKDIDEKGILVCPECKRPFPEDGRKEHVVNCRKKVEVLNKEVSAIEDKVKEVIEAAETIDKEKRMVAKTRNDLSDNVQRARTEVSRQEELTAKVKDELEHRKNNPSAAYTALEKEISGLVAVLKFCKEEKDNSVKSLDKLMVDIESMSTSKNYASFWYDGFNKIRESVLNKFLTFFTDSLREMLSSSGLMFDDVIIEAAASGGERVKRTSLDIFLLRGEDRISISSLSEGETRRFDLCCFYALREMLTESAAVKFDWVVLDEPLNGLDDSGRESMHTAFGTMSKNNQVFVIDHDGNFQGRFNNRLLVKKLHGISFAEWA